MTLCWGEDEGEMMVLHDRCGGKMRGDVVKGQRYLVCKRCCEHIPFNRFGQIQLLGKAIPVPQEGEHKRRVH